MVYSYFNIYFYSYQDQKLNLKMKSDKYKILQNSKIQFFYYI